MVASSARYRVHRVEWTTACRGVRGRKAGEARETKRDRHDEQGMPPGQVETQCQRKNLSQGCADHSRGQTDQGKLAQD